MPNVLAGSPQVTSGPGPTGPGYPGPPRYPTRFVGRRVEVATLRGLLRPGRLVTVVGLGGAGKTRVASELVTDGECVWVDLSDASVPGDVAGAVAEALRLPAGGGADPTIAVVNVLRAEPTLLVIDNCEAQQRACRELVDALLLEMDALTVLATSRVPLDSAYEWLFPLPPLAEGDELFTDRAARVGYAPVGHDAGVVTELCRRVGGSPLAIELLAAWSHVKSPAELLATQPEGLSSPTLTVQPRHRDMTAVLDASMALLASGQQRVLGALGVFAGGFTAEAAESVAEADLGTLAVLVERGLIFREPTAGGRFSVHELVRSHALARLRSDGDDREDAVRRRHFDYFVGLAEPWTDQAVSSQPHRDNPLKAENANLDAARRWAVERGDAGSALRLMQALDLFWPYASPPKPRRYARLADVLALPFDSDDRTVLLNRAWACHTAGQLIMREPAQARKWFEESLDHFHVLGHEGGEAAALRGLMEASLVDMDLDAAEAYGDRARAVGRRANDRPGEAWMIFQDAMLALARDQPEHAAVCAREARNVFEERGADYGIYSAYGILSAVCLLGEAHYAQGRYTDAVTAYEEAVSIQGRTGFVRDVEDLLEDLAIVAAALGADERPPSCRALLRPGGPSTQIRACRTGWRIIGLPPRPAAAASVPDIGRPPSTPALG